MMNSNIVAVIDFGGQYTHLIARRVREQGVLSEIFSWDVSPKELIEKSIKSIIFSGGPNSVYATNAPKVSVETMTYLEKEHIPILGLCYGHQFISLFYGGTVSPGNQNEYGKTIITIQNH
nr:GMP synthase (glutamine-hydrolyzing) [Asgard group archaeon]